MIRDFSNIDKYLDILSEDVYSQPSDFGHNKMLRESIKLLSPYFEYIDNVLDIGCGEDLISFPYFNKMQINYTGITLGDEAELLKDKMIKVHKMDMSFLEFEDGEFDMIFARHVLEHSPMVLLTLLEWHRVSNRYLFLVLPNPRKFGYIGRNHYSVMPKQLIRWLLRRAGWKIIDKKYTNSEFRFVCEKMPLIGYEGWATDPLPNKIYEEDRDG